MTDASPLLVTLDGPAGVGKTSVARRLAEALDIAYLDTGAMFRALAWSLGAAGQTLDEARLHERLVQLEFTLIGSGESSQLLCNGQPLTEDIRTETVGAWASRLATLPVVREQLKRAQQAIGVQRSLTAEGRDMGSVVFPQARFKFFLDAAAEVRARRRFLQLQELNLPADFATLVEQIRQRDAQDRNRPVAPLAPAPDARVIDTTDMNLEQVFTLLLRTIRP